jgi:hypothetical protein
MPTIEGTIIESVKFPQRSSRETIWGGAFWILTIVFLLGNGLPGLWERVGSYPIIVRCVVRGYCFLRWSREAERP